MSMKHTPGPWRVYKGMVHPNFDGPSPQATNADTVICEPLGPDSAANARLIAAAPELLEALCDIVSDHAELSEATLQFARSVITKAVGYREYTVMQKAHSAQEAVSGSGELERV